MLEIEKYLSEVPDWATSIEYLVQEPRGEIRHEDFLVAGNALFLVAVVSTQNGFSPSYLDARIRVQGPEQALPLNEESPSFESPDGRLCVINRPQPGRWRVQSQGKTVPYAINILAFHPLVPPMSRPSPGPSGASPFKCRACKITAKALAVSIVTAATLPALPAALITMVASYLGVSAMIAATFIASVLGDTADIISEKLCKKVGLC